MDKARLFEITLGSKTLQLPAYFPSISSLKTALSPIDYLRFLIAVQNDNKQFLISAYDIKHTDNLLESSDDIKLFRANGGIVLLDSGNYESFWKQGREIWSQQHFHEILQTVSCDIAFSFDNQEPQGNISKQTSDIIFSFKTDQDVAKDKIIVPIIHTEIMDFPEICFNVAQHTDVLVIAVAERKLGAGIFERAQTIKAIRAKLNELNRYVALHVLGTGNPISLATFSAMGADSFDGLEWCQTVVDPDTALLYHLSHADFFIKTLPDNEDLSFHAKSLAHNIAFYIDWMNGVRHAVQTGTIVGFCKNFLPPPISTQLSSLFER